MKKFELDSKNEWRKNRWRLMNEIMRDQTVSTDDKKYYLSMKDTIICESPKTYIDGVAYNDGSWVIFNTFKSKKSGKIIGNIKINSKESFIKTIYSYMVFLKMTGIRNNKALVYFSIVFFDRLTYQKGLFDFNNKNIGILYNLADKVLKKLDQELTKDWTRGRTKDRIGCWDDRKFCMDTKGMNKSDTPKRRNKILNKNFIISYMTIYDQKMTKRSASNNKKQNGICLIADL